MSTCAGAGAEPRRAGAAATARRSARVRRHDREAVARHHDGRAPRLARRPLRRTSTSATTRCSTSGTSSRACPAWATCTLFGAGDYACACGSTRTRSPRAASRRATSCSAIREQNVQVAAGTSAQPPAPTGSRFQLTRQRARAGSSTKQQFGNIIVKTGARRRRGHALRDVARIELGAEALRAARLLDNKSAVAIASSRRRAPTRSRSPSDVRETMAELEDASRRASTYEIVYDPTLFVRDVDPRGGRHAARGDAAGRPRRRRCSCRPGARRSSRSPRCRCRSSARSR